MCTADIKVDLCRKVTNIFTNCFLNFYEQVARNIKAYYIEIYGYWTLQVVVNFGNVFYYRKLQ